MQPTGAGFPELIRRVRAGCPDAARELYEVYRPIVIRVIRRRLQRQLRRIYDSHDLEQSVFAAFFAGEFEPFTTPEELVRYLCGVASNKAAELTRQRLIYQKHNLNREVPLNAPDADPAKAPAADPPSRTPTPSQVAIAREVLDAIMERCDVVEKEALRLIIQGYTYDEVWEQTGLHPKKIQRLRRMLREGANS
jgi:RNA polymerase sigma factor (sigma-70 family)